MDITPANLGKEFEAARKAWGPVFDAVEKKYNLPQFLLYALGSRESSLSPRFLKGATGDQGHAHGVFQFHDRWHPEALDPVWQASIEMQADAAGNAMAHLLKRFELVECLNRYNSGQKLTEKTANHNYGPETIARMHYLQNRYGVALAAPKYPLPSGHWFGVSPGDSVHSVDDASTSDGILKLTSRLEERGWKVKPGNVYTTAISKTVKQFQKEKGILPTGGVGVHTWKALWDAPIT